MKHRPQPEQPSIYDDYFVRQLVPEDHELLQIDREVDFSFVGEEVTDLYSDETGREAINPELLFRLNFLQAYDDLSGREVIKRSRTDLAYRCFLHLGLEDDLPDHSTLSVFRRRLGVERFERIFNRSVTEALERGLVTGRMVLVDSSGIIADAAIPRLRRLLIRLVRKAITALEDLGADISGFADEHDELIEDNSWMLSTKLREKDVANWAALASQVRDTLEQFDPDDGGGGLVELLDEALAREDGSAEGATLVSDVDPDARWSVAKRGKKPFVGYKMQIATDADSEIITDAEVTPANVDDSTQFEGLVDGHQRRAGKPEAVAADSGYNSGENRNRLSEDGIEDFIMPPTAKGHRQGMYSATDFDPEFDDDGVPLKVTCPAGEVAEDGKWQEDKDGWRFYFKKGQCEGCEHREQCSTAKYGRAVFISRHYRAHQAARARAEGDEFKAAQIERLGIERTFAHQQRWAGIQRTRYRGLEAVKIGVLIACFVTNVVRRTRRARAGPRPAREE
jgi:IS5 family transposase